MSDDDDLPQESAEELFENAPCGYLTTRTDGTIVRVNRTFEAWTGFRREELLGRRRFQDLLSPGARIYHETHYAPLLQMQGSVREIAVEIVRADGSRLAALVNSVLVDGEAGGRGTIKTTVFDATDRRRYEQELMRARLREQDTAQQLQRSLLSGELPQAAGLEVEVGYRPAVPGLEVGGDWYDASWLDDGESIGLVVGDVVGRGIEAAATMGQLRSATRALASTGLSPGPLLEAVDRYAHRHQVGRMATLACAQLHVGTRRLTYACAGHPPPLLAGGDDPPRLLWEARSLPLDAYVESGPRAEAEELLPPDSLVLLYTDGLIERRGRTLTEGLDRLLAEVAGRRGRPPAELAPAIVRALHDPEHADDVCLLAALLA